MKKSWNYRNFKKIMEKSWNFRKTKKKALGGEDDCHGCFEAL